MRTFSCLRKMKGWHRIASINTYIFLGKNLGINCVPQTTQSSFQEMEMNSSERKQQQGNTTENWLGWLFAKGKEEITKKKNCLNSPNVLNHETFARRSFRILFSIRRRCFLFGRKFFSLIFLLSLSFSLHFALSARMSREFVVELINTKANCEFETFHVFMIG